MAVLDALTLTMLNVLCMSLLVHFMAFTSPYWSGNDVQHFGLWKRCCWNSCYDPDWKTDWQHATGAMMTLSMLCIIGSSMVAAIYIFMENFRSKPTALVVAGSAFTSVFCGVVAVSVFAAKSQSHRYQFYCLFDFKPFKLLWGFYLAVVHSVLSFLGAVLAVVVALRTDDES